MAYLKVVENPPELWAIEPKRNNDITIKIQLFDSSHNMISNIERIKLIFTLCYENEIESLNLNQNILNCTRQGYLENGESIIQFRINELSSKHHGRKFAIKIEEENNFYIADYTTPIQVMSKYPNSPLNTMRKKRSNDEIQISTFTNNNDSNSGSNSNYRNTKQRFEDDNVIYENDSTNNLLSSTHLLSQRSSSSSSEGSTCLSIPEKIKQIDEEINRQV